MPPSSDEAHDDARPGEGVATGSVPIRTVGSAPDGLLDGVPVYDLRGLQCPLPVLKAGRRIRGMAPGERLWLETTDPLAVIDVPAFARENGHRLVESRDVEGGHRFLIERGEG